ncbi:GIY-YIG nuclease family protein [Candidatus Gracilibacteria bacterium]|nr:GIY-YIG nuclease family protein [Candidatus Gracilibacteria bacterium]
MSERQYAVYILASRKNGTLYTGVTGDLENRVFEHKEKLMEGFTKKYNVQRLVYYELHESPEHAIMREKQIKKWKRTWKLNIIEKDNPQWKDLYNEFDSLTKREERKLAFIPERVTGTHDKIIYNPGFLPSQEGQIRE